MNAKKLGALLVIVAAMSSVGCAIHVQGPVREVAYDYSDHDFYDRAFAPSPNYRSLMQSPTIQDAAFAPVQGSRLAPPPAVSPFAPGR